MQLKTNYDNLSADVIRVNDLAQFVVGVDILLAETEGVQKVLSVSPSCRIQSAECGQDSVRVSGTVVWRVIYQPASGELKSVEYLSDFTDTIAVEGILPDQKIIVSGKIIDSTSKLKDNSLNIEAVIELASTSIIAESVLALVSTENSMQKLKDVETMKMIAFADDKFNIYEEFDINGNIERILDFNAKPIIKAQESGDAIISVAGDVLVDLTYITDRGVETRNYSMPFKEDIRATGAEPMAKIFACPMLLNCKLLMSHDNNNTIIRVDSTIGVKAPVFVPKYTTIVEDLYSPNFDITVTRDKLNTNAVVCDKYYEEKISGLAPLEEDMPAIQYILATTDSMNSVSNIIPEDGFVVVEGVLSANVIYQDYDNNINSVQVELPYSLRKNLSEVYADSKVIGQVVDCGTQARVRRDKEIELCSDLKIMITVLKNDEINYIKEAVQGEEKAKNAKAISIYFAKQGDTLWDIGKALGASSEKIKQLNPTLNEPLKNNEQVSIYRQLTIDENII